MQRNRHAGARPAGEGTLRSLVVAGAVAMTGIPGHAPDARAQSDIAVEYYHAGWDHYFVTAFPDEIAALDAGAFSGEWRRTGLTFDVWSAPVGEASPTCRFFGTAFAPRSSHFYTPYASECESVKGNAEWQFEALSFFLRLPGADGRCPAGTSELYRSYNNGGSGAPNHRYTISVIARDRTDAADWTPEGDSATGVFACVPAAGPGALPAGPVVVATRPDERVQLPPSDESWQIEYTYRVPPLPSSPGWDSGRDAFYVWGGVDFDGYGEAGAHPLSDYRHNHVVPQLFVGRVLSGSDANFAPSWSRTDTWAIQAQYYWQKGGAAYAQTGSVVAVGPGDEVTTRIGFDASSGRLAVSVAAAAGTSAITVDRPFPNEPALFADWAEFFRRAELAAGGLRAQAHPAIAVRPFADRQAMCSILPLRIDRIAIPGVAGSWTQFLVSNTSGLACGKAPAILAF